MASTVGRGLAFGLLPVCVPDSAGEFGIGEPAVLAGLPLRGRPELLQTLPLLLRSWLQGLQGALWDSARNT